ncbi:LOW QUALITY PROTEIN: hypothetical protein NC653_039545 [Populus alba x Populus x berolinensis]|uniref:Uncharacterized protein n=1 Tax=Populus alba x Populus x berolinensis TaxID=444605 RepID=A0AAD6PS81_9ROSI|nr:LOW QUALITY PROTEIN: hypothetical protein NC653_039545 [Populus alba x Populus x berolinensis]
MNNPTPNKKREGKSVEIRGRLEFKRSHMRNNKQIASPIIIIYKVNDGTISQRPISLQTHFSIIIFNIQLLAIQSGNTFPIVHHEEEIPVNLRVEETDHLTTRRSIGPCAALTLTHSKEVGVGNIATKYLLASYLELKRRSRKAGRVGDVTSIYLRQSRNSGLLVHGSSLRLCLPRKVCNNLTFTYTLPEVDINHPWKLP